MRLTPTPLAPEHRLLRRLGPYLRPHRGVLWSAVVLAVGGQALLALVPLLQKVIVDDAIVDDRRALLPLIGVLLGVGIVGFVAHATRRYLGTRLSFDVQHDLRVAIHRHLHALDARAHDRLAAGDVLARATADATLVQLYLAQLPLLVANLTLVTVGLVVMASLSLPLFAVVATCVPVLAVLGVRFRDRAFPSSWNDQQLGGSLTANVEEAVVGVRVVKAFGREDREVGRFVGGATGLFASRMRTARLTARYSSALQAVPGLGQLGVLAVGGWLAYQGHITVGVFLAFASYLVQLVTPVRLIAGMVGTAQQARAGMQRISGLLATEPTISDPPDAAPLVHPRGAVALDGVGFCYAGDGVGGDAGTDPAGGPQALADVSLRIEPGETVAVVGASGAGKSTLGLLIGRIYDPTEGVVSIGGTDLRLAALESVRRAVAYVFEDSILFTGTIRDNIAYARPTASDPEVEAVARLARADGFVRALPDGYSTEVGERGLTLSGGQRQRLALARALLAEAPILVLDDATSAIDVQTEEAIFTDPAFAGRRQTTVLIARRPSTVRLADRVVVLDRGRVVAAGTDAELRVTSPLYRELLIGPEAAGEVPVLPDAVDPSAWPVTVRSDSAPEWGPAVAGVDGGGGGPLGGGRAGLVTATPDLIARVQALPPAHDAPEVDVVALRTGGDGEFGFAQLLRPFRRALALVAALMVVDAATTLAGPLLFRYGIDHGVVGGARSALVTACVVYLAVQLLSWVNARAMQFAAARTAERVLFSLRVRTFAHLQRLSLDFYERLRSGQILTRLTSDVDALAQLVQQGLVTAIVSMISCVGVLVVLLVLDVRLALVVLTVMPLLAAGGWWFVRGSTRAYFTARRLISELNGDLQEHLAGVRVTQSAGRVDEVAHRFAATSRRHRDARRRSGLMIAVFFPYLALLANLAKALTLVAGARLIADDALAIGVLVAFLLYADQFFAPLQQLSMALDQWIQARVSFARIADLLRTPPSVTNPPAPVSVGRLRGEVTFENVRFAYPPGTREVLRDVDLHIAPGEVVAIVGTTGAGKSTFVKLATRLYDPTAGRVLVDGVPLHQLDLTAFRRQVGYVPQEPFLFRGAVRDNIAYGLDGASDLEVERAARLVGAHDFIAALPGGYRTQLGGGTQSLSAGQRQLLCLARAQLIDPAVLVLDEATSNVDMATEARVQQAMGVLTRGRTTLLIAHRLRTAATADRIVVFEDGRPVESGTHADLLTVEGRYAAMWATFAHREQRSEYQKI